jgi:hypothetical protein
MKGVIQKVPILKPPRGSILLGGFLYSYQRQFNKEGGMGK